MALVEFDGVQKRFRKNEVLKGVNLQIAEKEIFGLIGKSGSGKSTILNLLVGLIFADEGEIFFEGKRVSEKLNYLRKNTGFASQENMLFNELTIKENSFYFGALYGLKRKKIKSRFNELLDLLQLRGFENTLVCYLSGGMAKRANLLVALIHNPKLLILDEPTVGLDPLLREDIWKYINKINDEGMTVLVTSHLIDEIENNCDRVAILKNGKILAVASPHEYKNKYGRTKSFQEIFEILLRGKF